MAATAPAGTQIESTLAETRVFPPPPAFAQRAQIRSMAEYQRLYQEALEDPTGYWGARGREEIYWKEPFKTVLAVNNAERANECRVNFNCVAGFIKCERFVRR